MSNALRDIIEAATPGPWKSVSIAGCVQAADSSFVARDCGRTRMEPHTRIDAQGHTWTGSHAVSDDARFIAAFDPEHVALMEAERQAYKAMGLSTPESLAVDAYRRDRGLHD